MMLYIIVLMITLSYTYYRLKNKRKFQLASEFDGPMVVPIFGNSLIFTNRSPAEVIAFFRDGVEKFGSIFKVWMGPRLVFIVTDPKICEIVLGNSTKFLEKSTLYDFLIPWLGTGLLLSKGQKWHNRRKIITPAFHFKILEEFCNIFDSQSDILVKNLKKHEFGDAFDITNYISLMALDVVCETAMGMKINAQTNAESTYVKAVHEAFGTRNRNNHILYHQFGCFTGHYLWMFLRAFTKNCIKKNWIKQTTNCIKDTNKCCVKKRPKRLAAIRASEALVIMSYDLDQEDAEWHNID